ncbi:MAG: GxxExxY protein [Xanthomonadales bacterium]|nr:GxxExxY protein [Xanthomonadales bacterium]MCB1633413.1 GxxExxY protein [Xanthomonadales bacterium]
MTRQTSTIDPPDARTEALAKVVIDAAFRVHSELGPGLLESVYEACLAYELEAAGVPFDRQAGFPVRYRGLSLEAGLRMDLCVGRRVAVEIKVVEKLAPIHRAQLLSYLRLSGLRLGLLLNFNVVHLKDGIKRIVL